jgi:ComF family protein
MERVTTSGERAGGARWGALDALVHLLLPSPCLGCGTPLPARRSPLALCRPCRGALPAAPEQACDGCGAPLLAAALPAGFRCGACRARAPAFRRLVVPFRYAPPLDAVILALKFRRLERLGGDLAVALATAASERLGGCDLVVPVPLHWRRRLSRGYNQAERIARPLATLLGLPAATPLVRRRPTPPQTSLDRAERRRNLRGAFATPRPAALRGRTVALVDDVVTTGATLEAAARCLLAAGAVAVVAVAVARTPLE